MTDTDQRILVISDDDTNALVAAALLSRRGHPVARSTRREATANIRSYRPSVVIYDAPKDAPKPELAPQDASAADSGDQTLEALPFHHVIVLGDDQAPCRCADPLARGAVAKLQKPFNIDAVEKILGFLLTGPDAVPN